MPVYDIDGHWFHSRSSSSKGELEHIGLLVVEGRNSKYARLKWSENVPLAEELASRIGIETSTMRTKIRAFIRFGFLKEKRECPLEWSSLGSIWEGLTGYTNPKIKDARDDIEQLIISAALAIYSFDSEGYQTDPSNGFNPLTTLILNLDSKRKISREDFAKLVGSRNETYWRIDFLRSGMFSQKDSYIFHTGKFPLLFESCKKVSWPKNLRKDDWEEIHQDFLNPRNPLSEVIKEELYNILNRLRDDVARLVPKVEQSIDKMEEILEQRDEKDIEIGNYSIPDTFSKAMVRAKQNAWSKIVRRIYSFKCCVPACDSEGEFLVESSHIKPYSQKDDEALPHRANPANGLCFCPNCHKLFDKGYFSFTDDLKLVLSPELIKLKEQKAVNLILNSKDTKINPLPKKYPPHKEFLKYHRQNVLRK